MWHKIKNLEMRGYQFEAAEGSLELPHQKALGIHKSYFDLIGFRIIVRRKKRPILSRKRQLW
jgi:2-isopropylmalate synthase